MKTKKQAEDYLSLMTMYRISRPKYCSKYRFGTPEKKLLKESSNTSFNNRTDNK